MFTSQNTRTQRWPRFCRELSGMLLMGAVCAALPAGAVGAVSKAKQPSSPPAATATPTPVLDAAPATELAPPPSPQATPVPAAETRCRVVVLDLKANGLPSDEAHIPRLLTEALADEVATSSGCTVMTQGDVTAMMDLGAAQLACGAESDACLAEIGSALGADFLVTGAVGALADKRIIGARLLDMKAGVVAARAQEQRPSINDLDRATRDVGGRLFGKESSSSSSSSVATGRDGGGASGLFWGGVVVTALGLGTTVVGGGVATMQELSLSTANARGKDDALGLGRIMLGVGAVGVAVATAGIVMMGLSGDDDTALASSGSEP